MKKKKINRTAFDTRAVNCGYIRKYVHGLLIRMEVCQLLHSSSYNTSVVTEIIESLFLETEKVECPPSQEFISLVL